MDLPGRNEPGDVDYMHSDTKPYSEFKIHWCFVADIIGDLSLGVSVFDVPALQALDREGEITTILLCYDNVSQHDLRDFVIGHTICLMYACRQMSSIIRVDDSRFIQGNNPRLTFAAELVGSIALFFSTFDDCWRSSCYRTSDLQGLQKNSQPIVCPLSN
jgi:hypothetical protein